MKKAEIFFSPEDRKRISEATREVETRTVGEVVVMVVDESDSYPEAEIIGGVLLGSFISFALTEAFLGALLWTYILLSLASFYPAKLFVRALQPLKTVFVTAGRMHHAVRDRALRAFYEKGLYRTKEHTGVLIFISLFEKKVWVLADKGIYKRIDQKTLNGFAATVSEGFKKGQACEALCQAISDAGKVLEQHFPMKPGDTNELSNEVITD